MLDRLLYRDGLILIINKPHGIPVHAGPKGGENMEDYFHHLKFGLPRPPFLAHRLDRDTSGCLILGRHPKALRRMGKLFESGRVEKTYWAIVEGRPPQDQGIIDASLEKVKTPKGWSMKISDHGQKAITEYKILDHKNGLSWLELSPKTGRTHQLRVHCQHLGCPIVGDWMYGTKKTLAGDPLLHLHARSVIIPLYPSKDPIEATAPPPAHMQAWCG